MEQLSFFPNEDLIKELLSRTTFAGIILKPTDPIEELEFKPIVQFDMFWSPRLPSETVKKLLEKALAQLDQGE